MRKHLVKLILTATTLSCVLEAQPGRATLTVNEPRPLAAICLEIERLSGVPINYEDVQYANASDLQDVTDQIMNSGQRAQSLPGVRVIVPKAASLTLAVDLDKRGMIPDPANALAAVLTAMSAYHASSTSRFGVNQLSGSLYVQPEQVLDEKGVLKRLPRVLATPVTIDFKSRNAFEALSFLLDTLSRKSGIKVAVGMVPINAFVRTQVSISTNNEAAELALTRLFDAMKLGAMSYAMFYDPVEKYYVLNIHVVPDLKPQSSTAGPEPIVTPSSAGGVFYKKN